MQMIVQRRPWHDVGVIGVEQIGRPHVGARDMDDRRDHVERMDAATSSLITTATDLSLSE